MKMAKMTCILRMVIICDIECLTRLAVTEHPNPRYYDRLRQASIIFAPLQAVFVAQDRSILAMSGQNASRALCKLALVSS